MLHAEACRDACNGAVVASKQATSVSMRVRFALIDSSPDKSQL